MHGIVPCSAHFKVALSQRLQDMQFPRGFAESWVLMVHLFTLITGITSDI